jgi:hypothetical protein
MSLFVIVILVAVAVGLVGTLVFGPLLLAAGVLILILGLAGARWFGRGADTVADVAKDPSILRAPEPQELSEDARTAAQDASAERATRRAGTT